MATSNARGLPDMPVLAKEKAKSLTWTEIETDQSKAIDDVVALTRFSSEEAKKFEALLCIAVKAYARKRIEESLWKECEGKQVLSDVAKSIGFGSVSAMTQATFAAWSRGSAPVSTELQEFRQHLSSL
jgi:hypothetical protein